MVTENIYYELIFLFQIACNFFSNCNWIFQNIMNSAMRYCTNKNIANVNCSMISLHLFFWWFSFFKSFKMYWKKSTMTNMFLLQNNCLKSITWQKEMGYIWSLYLKKIGRCHFYLKKIEIAYYIKRNVFFR